MIPAASQARWRVFGRVLPSAPGGAALACALLLAHGCADVCDDPVLPRCDVRDADCQAQTLEVTACLRGGEGTREVPPISVISPAELEVRLRAGADPAMMEAAVFESVLKQLGMLEPTVSFVEAQVQDSVARVGALYIPDTGEILIVDRGEPMDSTQQVTVLVHELVHAAQDAESDLDGNELRSHEELMAWRSAVEGEATFYQLEALAWAEGLRADELDWTGYYDETLGPTYDRIASARSPYFEIYGVLPYLLGGRQATARWFDGGDAAVRAGLATPASSAHLLADPFAGAPDVAEARPAPRCPDAPPPPDGYEPQGRDEMGAVLVFALLERLGAPRWSARQLAQRWQGDQLWTFAGPDGEAAFAWRIDLDRAPSRHEVPSMGGTGRVSAYADGVLTIASANDPEALAAWRWSGSPAGCGAP